LRRYTQHGLILGSWEVTLFKSLEGLLGWVSGSGGINRLDPTPSADVLARAEAGDAEAANDLGLWYTEIQPASRKAEFWFRRAADAGLARAQYNMGVLTMRSGRTAESIQWLRQAVSGRWPSAPFALGSLLEEQGDREGAFEAFETGARRECALSQDALGRLALEEETQASFEAARYWSEKSAKQGCASAQARMGTIFHEGLGVARDPERAVWWFLQAAKQNHAGAQAMIGVASHLGIGTEADRFNAMRMLMLSAAQGNPMAKAYLPTVNAELTPDERVLIEEWMDRIGRERKAAKKDDT
jgi:TPR repeat protein